LIEQSAHRVANDIRSTFDSDDVAFEAIVRDEDPDPREPHSFVSRDDPERGIYPSKRRAPDLYEYVVDLSPRVGDLMHGGDDFMHRGDDFNRPPSHLITRPREKQTRCPKLKLTAGDFNRSVVDIRPILERIPRLVPHM
jgi:hypothetical protein